MTRFHRGVGDHCFVYLSNQRRVSGDVKKKSGSPPTWLWPRERLPYNTAMADKWGDASSAVGGMKGDFSLNQVRRKPDDVCNFDQHSETWGTSLPAWSRMSSSKKSLFYSVRQTMGQKKIFFRPGIKAGFTEKTPEAARRRGGEKEAFCQRAGTEVRQKRCTTSQKREKRKSPLRQENLKRVCG